jgi:hypothetical protein
MRVQLRLFRILLSFIFGTLSLSVSAQSQIKWTNQEKESSLPNYYVKQANGNLVTFNVLNNSNYLKNVLVKVYDSKNKLIHEIDHKAWENSSWKSSDYNLESFKEFNNEIVLIISKKEDKVLKIYANVLDKNYKAGKQLKLLGDIGMAKSSSSTSFIQILFGILTFNPFMMVDVNPASNGLKYTVSKDQTKHLYYNFTDDKSSKYLEVFCFSDKFNLLYKQKHPLKVYKGKAFVYGEVRILNNGDILFNYKGKGEKVKMIYNLVKLYDNGKKNKVKEYDNEDDAIVLDKYASLSEEEDKLFAFYKVSPNKKKNTLSGFVLYEVYLNTLNTKIHNSAPIDEELIYKMYSDKRAGKVKLEKGIDDRWKMIKFKCLADNSKIAVLEDMRQKTTTYTRGNGTVATYYSYFYGDILVLKFNSENELEWTKVLYRKQGYYTESTLPYMGTIVFNHGSDLHLIYNDGGKNIQAQGYSGSDSKDKVVKAGNIKKSNAVMKSISSDGTVQSKIIFNGAVNDEIMLTESFRTLDKNTILLMATIRKKMKFGTLVFGENNDKAGNLVAENSLLTENNTSESELPESSIEDYTINKKLDSLRVSRGLAPLYRYPEPQRDEQPSQESPTPELTKEDMEKEDLIADQRNARLEELKKQINSVDPNDFYTVQILASKEKIENHEYLEKIKGVTIRNEDGMYKYIVGNFNSEEIAMQLQTYLQKQGVEGFVVHYLNNKRVLD